LLNRDIVEDPTSDGVSSLRKENPRLKELVAETILENLRIPPGICS
jgi:hypothetical protein